MGSPYTRAWGLCAVTYRRASRAASSARSPPSKSRRMSLGTNASAVAVCRFFFCRRYSLCAAFKSAMRPSGISAPLRCRPSPSWKVISLMRCQASIMPGSHAETSLLGMVRIGKLDAVRVELLGEGLRPLHVMFLEVFAVLSGAHVIEPLLVVAIPGDGLRQT